MFEDLHWAEPTLMELIEYIVSDDGTAAPFILTARPDFLEPNPISPEAWARAARARGPARRAGTELLGALGDTSLAQTEFAGKLIANAGGNPLFLEETVRMLKDEGLLDGQLAGSKRKTLPSRRAFRL